MEHTVQNKTPPVKYQPYMEYTKAHYRAYANFLGEMANTKLCVFDSSVARKSIRKYYEAMVAGCVIVADVPMDSFDEVGRNMIQIPHTLRSREKFVQAVKLALGKGDQELQSMAQRARNVALKRFTCLSKVDRLLDDAHDYRRGRRGYKFPFSTSLECHHYLGLHPHPKNFPGC